MSTTPAPVDKSQAGLDTRQYHIGIAPGCGRSRTTGSTAP